MTLGNAPFVGLSTAVKAGADVESGIVKAVLLVSALVIYCMNGSHYIRVFLLGSAAVVLCAFVTAAPLPARAAGLTDTQIQAVLNLLSAFNASSAVINQVNNALHNLPVAASTTIGSQNSGEGESEGWSVATNMPAAWVCGSSTVPGLNLQRGDTNRSNEGEVSQLQQFLSAHFGVASSTIVTGYFGSVTEDYLQRFQSEEGVPSTGFFGPLSRDAMARFCGGSSAGTGEGESNFASTTPTRGAGGSEYQSTMPSWLNSNQSSSTVASPWQSTGKSSNTAAVSYGMLSLGAYPVSGQAPLTVSFLIDLGSTTGAYRINYGDSTTTEQALVATCAQEPDGSTVCGTSAKHTYKAPGVYHVSLVPANGSKSVTITVASSSDQ